MKFLLILLTSSIIVVGTSIESYGFDSIKQFDLIKLERSECAQQAVIEILPFCITGNTLTSGMRRSSATKLAICEFESTGIVYPLSCKNLTTDREEALCIMDLEASPQFWTTFSGYYRDVHTICYEESLPYEKEQIVDLFSNITKVYKSFYDEMKESQVYSEKAQTDLQGRFDEMVIIFNNTVEESYRNQQGMNEEFSDFNANLGIILENALEIINDTTSTSTVNLQLIGAHLNFFAAEMEQVADSVSNLPVDLHHLQNQILDSYGVLSDKSKEYLDELMNTMEQANSISQYNQDLALGINSELTLANTLVTNLNIDSLLENITTFLNSELEISVQELNVLMDDFLNSSFHKIDSKMNETFSNLESLNSGFDMILSEFNSLIGFIYDGISSVSRISIFGVSKSIFSNLGMFGTYFLRFLVLCILAQVLIVTFFVKKVAKFKILSISNISGLVKILALLPCIVSGIVMAMIFIRLVSSRENYRDPHAILDTLPILDTRPILDTLGQV